MAYSEYRDLTPIDSVENGDEYIEALNWAFQNKKVKNIALTGPYGAGKSSIIETFLRKNDEDKSALNKIRISALKISMATFLKGNAATDEPNGKIQIDADEVEKGILKQLFYKVEPGKIPQSRYRKLHPIKKLKTFFYVLMTMLACFDENIPDSVMKTIAKRQPLRVVFRDSSFAGSPAKINVTQIFKELAPDTSVKVL